MKLAALALLFASSVVASPLTKRYGTTTTYTSGATANDIANGVCAPLTVVFAKGTGEFGNIGAIIGPQFFSALKSGMNGQVALQGVDYAADVAGDADFGAEGATNMTAFAAQALSQCPNTRLALSGYSQGGMVVHYALNTAGLPSNAVWAIVYFGDPEYNIGKSGTVAASRIQQNCASGDGVCEKHGAYITAAHLSYGSADARSAAQFVMQTTGMMGNASYRV